MCLRSVIIAESVTLNKTYLYTDYLPLSPIFEPKKTFANVEDLF